MIDEIMGEIIGRGDTISINTDDFEEIKLRYNDFCGYYKETGELCPLMQEDIKQNKDSGWWINRNFTLSICLLVCKYYIKTNIPKLLKLKEVKKKNG